MDKKWRILLIEPPFFRLFKSTYSLDRYPLSLGYLSGIIKKETTWDVLAYNADFSLHQERESIKHSYLAGQGFNNYLDNLSSLSHPVWEEIKSTIMEYRPAVIGITSKSPNFASVRRIAHIAKGINKEIIVTVGGPHVSMVKADVLKCPDIDIAVKGEGEYTIIELLTSIQNRDKLDDIKGVIYRKNNQIAENEDRILIDSLDSLCFPHENAPYVLKDYNLYPKSAFGNIFATRGCPNNCFFCGSRNIWTRKVRFRTPDNVVAEIKKLQRIGISSIHFDDDTFGINKSYIKSLCNCIIENCPEIKWSSEIHVNLVDDENMALMKKAGCYLTILGIESGNNVILKKIRKGFTIDKALHAADTIRKNGIRVDVFFMIGLPWETEDTIADTIWAMDRINASFVTYSIFTPYPGTEAFEYCNENGMIDEEFDISLYNHQSPKNCFCLNIPKDKFRIIASQIEEKVDKINSRKKIKSYFSIDTLNKVKEIGLSETIKKAIKIFITR